MSITPLDIQNKEFERAFRGYDMEDVDEFLDQVATDLENLIRENVDLKEKLSQLMEKNKNYQKLEETMHSAIVIAQETADEVKKSAKREADLIRLEAEREAKQVVEEARHRSNRVLTEQESLIKQAQLFKMRFRSFVEAQLAALDEEKWIDEADVDEKKDQEALKVDRKDDFEAGDDSAAEVEQDQFGQTSEFVLGEPEAEPDYKKQSFTEFDPEPESDLESELDLEPEPDFESDFEADPPRRPDQDRGFREDKDSELDFTTRLDQKKRKKFLIDDEFDSDPEF